MTIVLDRALADGRILVTHDRTTMPARIAARMQNAIEVPGVVVARLEHTSVRSLVEDLIFLIDAATPDDWRYPIFIPWPR